MAAPPVSDRQLIDDAINVMRAAQARAPQDFLHLLGLVLGAAATLLLLMAALIGEGFLRDTSLNLSAELFGAWFTATLINGVWSRLQVGAFAEYEAMAKELEKYRSKPLSADEREAWQLVVDTYRSAIVEWKSGNILRYAGSVIRSWSRARELRAQGNRVLQTFSDRIREQIADERDATAAPNDAVAAELSALREEVALLRHSLAATHDQSPRSQIPLATEQ